MNILYYIYIQEACPCGKNIIYREQNDKLFEKCSSDVVEDFELSSFLLIS